MDNNLILSVDGIWKKYCRQLKRAMWYGMRDIGRQLLARQDLNSDGPPNLRKGEFFAIRDANFQLMRGECVGMIGPNGAGKSTMLKMINGLIRPDAGKIEIRGRIGALIELGTGFNPILSGRENVYINAAVLGMNRRQTDGLFDQIVEFAGLADVISDPIKTYSSGMRVRLGFAVAAHLNPDLLIMDEVLAVGDAGFRMKCFQHLNELASKGTTIILVSHAVGMLPRVCSRTIVFDRGQIVFDGDVQQGIAVYERRMTPGGNCDGAALSFSAPDDREAWISRVEVVDRNGDELNGIETGDAIKLRVEVFCRRPVHRSRLIVNLGSPRADSICSTSSEFQSFRPDLAAGRHMIEFELNSLPLLVGGYFFNISLFGDDLYDFLDRATGVGAFQVTGPPIDASGNGLAGIMKLDHQWRLLDSVAESQSVSRHD